MAVSKQGTSGAIYFLSTLFQRVFMKSQLFPEFIWLKFKSNLDGHNKAKLSGDKAGVAKKCNCRESCPLEGDCGVANVVYRADVQNNNTIKTYFGQTTRPVKERIAEHKTSISTPKKALNRAGGRVASIQDQIEEKKNKSELSAYIWLLKSQNKNFKISWKIEKRALPYRNGNRYCDLCAVEKTKIALGDPSSTLNSRNEIFHKCRSRTKFTLQYFRKPP